MKKLDEFKVRWIILQKQKGESTSRIAETVSISTRWIKKIWARYKYMDPDRIVYPAPMGKLENGLSGRREHSVVLTARTEERLGVTRMHGIIRDSTGINIPYNKIHQILRDEGLTSEHPKKSERRNRHALSAPIRTPCGTQITSCSTTTSISCAMRTTHHVLSPDMACLITPLPKKDMIYCTRTDETVRYCL